MRLKSWIWVQAQVRICDRDAIPITIVKKGNEEAGAILLKLNRGEAGCELFSQVRTAEGTPAWLRVTGDGSAPEAAVDEKIGQEMKFDPDLWVIEIEDRKGQYQMDGEILS